MKIKLIGICLILVVIGAINWGAIGLFGLDLISSIFGISPTFVRVAYACVGAAGGYLAFLAKDILAFFGNRLLK
jgi:hypothetical protein